MEYFDGKRISKKQLGCWLTQVRGDILIRRNWTVFFDTQFISHFHFPSTSHHVKIYLLNAHFTDPRRLQKLCLRYSLTWMSNVHSSLQPSAGYESESQRSAQLSSAQLSSASALFQTRKEEEKISGHDSYFAKIQSHRDLIMKINDLFSKAKMQSVHCFCFLALHYWVLRFFLFFCFFVFFFTLPETIFRYTSTRDRSTWVRAQLIPRVSCHRRQN